MPRKSRLTTEKGSYHVIMRGNNRQDIFLDIKDRYKFLDFLQNIIDQPLSISGKETGKFEIYAYALMSNHFHLLIRVVSGALSDLIKRLVSSYVLYFNKKYHRDGHLFKERFRSEICENSEYFRTLLRYIHQNPIKAGLCTDLLKYRFTSWPEYIRKKGYPYHICSVDKVLEQIPIQELEAIIYDLLPDNLTCLDIDKEEGKISEQSILKYLKDDYGIENEEDIKKVDYITRNNMIKALLDYGASISQIHRLTGISKGTISAISRKTEEGR